MRPRYTANVLSLLDIVVVMCLALTVATGVRQGAYFAVGSFAAVVIFAVLVAVLPIALPIWVLAPLGLAVGMAGVYLSRVLPLPSLSPMFDNILGGLGGLVWGLVLIVGLWVSFPAQFAPSAGQYRYPSPQISVHVQRAVSDSPFARPLFTWALREPLARRVFLPHLKQP